MRRRARPPRASRPVMRRAMPVVGRGWVNAVSGTSLLDWSSLTESVPNFGEDCVDVFRGEDSFTFIVADGAGGMGGGGNAANVLVWRVRVAAECAGLGLDLDGWRALFRDVDQEIAKSRLGGETTGIVVVISPRGVMGVSAGDSEAWVVTSSGVDDLTAGQSRKRLGSGRARPVSFARPSLEGSLVVASDGLFGYATEQKIAAAVRGRVPDDAAERLRALVRLPSGRYQDDLAVVVVAPTT